MEPNDSYNSGVQVAQDVQSLIRSGVPVDQAYKQRGAIPPEQARAELDEVYRGPVPQTLNEKTAQEEVRDFLRGYLSRWDIIPLASLAESRAEDDHGNPGGCLNHAPDSSGCCPNCGGTVFY